MPRDDGKEPGIRPPGDSQLPPIEDRDRPREPGRGPNKPKPPSAFGELLNRTLLQTILLKYPGARSRVRQKVRNRKRGRSYRPSIYADPTGDTRASAKKTQTYRAPRPREGSTWRRIPGIASGGDIAAAAGEATAWWLLGDATQRSALAQLRRGRPLSDPGPRGRRPRTSAAAGASAPKRPSGGGGEVRRPLSRRIPAPLPQVVRPDDIELPDIGEQRGLDIPGISGAPVVVSQPGRARAPAPAPAARSSFFAAPGTFNLTQPRTAPRPLRASVRPRAQARAQALDQPLTALNSLGVPSIPTSDQDKCRCPRKKRKKGCTNPLISKSISGNVLTIKRELKCPPSNSKAR